MGTLEKITLEAKIKELRELLILEGRTPLEAELHTQEGTVYHNLALIYVGAINGLVDQTKHVMQPHKEV